MRELERPGQTVFVCGRDSGSPPVPGAGHVGNTELLSQGDRELVKVWAEGYLESGGILKSSLQLFCGT